MWGNLFHCGSAFEVTCMECLKIKRFWCQFVSTSTTNNVVTSQSLIVLIFLVVSHSIICTTINLIELVTLQHCLASLQLTSKHLTLIRPIGSLLWTEISGQKNSTSQYYKNGCSTTRCEGAMDRQTTRQPSTEIKELAFSL